MFEQKRTNKQFYSRLLTIAIFLTIILSFLIWRLWQVQIIQEAKHAQAVNKQSIRKIRITPARGRIITADNKILADNKPIYDLCFHISEMRQAGRRSKTTKYIIKQGEVLCKLLGRHHHPITRKSLEQHRYKTPAMPMTIFTDLSKQEMAILAEYMVKIPGSQIVPRIIRSYPYPKTATHILGYTGYNKKSISDYDKETLSYYNKELQGRNVGLEGYYNKILSGIGGDKSVKVDIFGYIYEELSNNQNGTNTLPPENGKDLHLTINFKAQKIAEKLLENKRAALVCLDVNTGAVIAMASNPTYDLTNFNYSTLRKDTKNKPLINRAAYGTYMPGSIIKPLLLLAALNHNAIDPLQTFTCPYRYQITPRCNIKCGHHHYEPITAVEALEQSCNPYFCNAGILCGLDNIQTVYAAAGIGKRPNLDLPSVSRGLLPSREIKQRIDHTPWNKYDTALISMGKGKINISPLQAAIYTAAIANGGKIYKPYLVDSITNPDGSVWRKSSPTVEQHLPIVGNNLAIVQEGMKRVVTGRHGTARRTIKTSKITLAGKTGTAKKSSNNKNDTWFIAYGPVNNPKYAIAVLVEDGRSGGKSAAPIVNSFFDQWLDKPITQ